MLHATDGELSSLSPPKTRPGSVNPAAGPPPPIIRFYRVVDTPQTVFPDAGSYLPLVTFVHQSLRGEYQTQQRSVFSERLTGIGRTGGVHIRSGPVDGGYYTLEEPQVGIEDEGWE
jgi:hypothetical protein